MVNNKQYCTVVPTYEARGFHNEEGDNMDLHHSQNHNSHLKKGMFYVICFVR
jgi:hypothetical protein